MTVLHMAANADIENVEIAKVLLERGASLENRDEHGNTELITASDKGCSKL